MSRSGWAIVGGIVLAAAIGQCAMNVARAAADEPPEAPKLSSAADLLDLYGADGARRAEFFDGRPVSDAEREPLLRMLNAARRFTLGDWYRWLEQKLPWSAWSEKPESVRGQVIQLRGRVRRVTVETPNEEQAERYDLPRYYRCELTLSGDEQPVVVYALTVPKAWKLDETPDKTLDERSGAKGIFIKLAGAAPEALAPVFVAARLAWYPDNELGHLGMDVGLFDEVENRTRLQASDSECFFELLAAVGRANDRELSQLTRDEKQGEPRYPVEPLFNRPQSCHGELLALSGTARRVVEIRVENPDVVRFLGVDHYYEIGLFTVDSQGNPITFCVRELPAGMPRGENLSEDVRIPGFFFKVWSYQLPEKDGKAQHQLAPLVVGRALSRLSPMKANTSFSTVVMIVLVTGMVLLALGLWWLNASDRAARRKLAQQHESDVRFDHFGKE
ncbi:MAG TPA: hypothetical protein VHZ24_18355 [Pirellulales bacterium]|jgi:hypothetical protein|nr:hypothetical protein [Pirellulales bacterium]